MLALLALATATLSACTPVVEPEPTPTAAFTSEEEAFAAAEEVYRAYLLAAASRAEGDDSNDPADYLTGEALEADIQAQRELNDSGITIVGASRIKQFVGLDADISGTVAIVSADICIDISGSRVIDTTGSDVTPSDRVNRGQLNIEFSGNADQLLISRSAPSGEKGC